MAPLQMTCGNKYNDKVIVLVSDVRAPKHLVYNCNHGTIERKIEHSVIFDKHDVSFDKHNVSFNACNVTFDINC